MDELERLSIELKQFLVKFDKRLVLGLFTQLLETSSLGTANDEIEKLSSPMRQLYYLAGLLMTSAQNGSVVNYTEEDCFFIVDHLNAIEAEYLKIFFPKNETEITDE